MADTVIPTIEDIITDAGGTIEEHPKTVIEALLLLGDLIESGSVDPAAIEAAVYDWLDEHPEATTTVQDGSITAAKLDAVILDDDAIDTMFGA